MGETFKITDPETKAPAVKNPYYQPKPGVLQNSELALDRLIAEGNGHGRVRRRDARPKPPAGRTRWASPATKRSKEFAANLLPGVTILPSGVWGVNRAQEAGCTYCAGGA